MPESMIVVEGLTKAFTLHNQNGLRIPVFENVYLTVNRGDCLVLHGPSGTGKSTLLRSLYANYLALSGAIKVRHNDGWVDMATAEPHEILRTIETSPRRRPVQRTLVQVVRGEGQLEAGAACVQANGRPPRLR